MKKKPIAAAAAAAICLILPLNALAAPSPREGLLKNGDKDSVVYSVQQKLYESGAFDFYLILGHHGRLAYAYDAQGMPFD